MKIRAFEKNDSCTWCFLAKTILLCGFIFSSCVGCSIKASPLKPTLQKELSPAEEFTLTEQAKSPVCTQEDTQALFSVKPLVTNSPILIAFFSEQHGDRKIYLINSDGSGQRPLTKYIGDVLETNFFWSPDGQKILFTAWYAVSDVGGLYIYNLGTDHTCRVATEIGARGVSWSSDSAHILYDKFDDQINKPLVYSMLPDGSDKKIWLNGEYEWGVSSVAWSPDGTNMAFVIKRDKLVSLYTANADGTNQRKLAPNSFYYAWSPDNQHIVFLQEQTLFVIDVDGSNKKVLTEAFVTTHPQWSPDGKTILFESWRDGNLEIYRIDSTGENPIRLTNYPGVDKEPIWSPDSKKIVFASNKSGSYQLYTMNADGTGQTRLTNNKSYDETPIWQPSR